LNVQRKFVAAAMSGACAVPVAVLSFAAPAMAAYAQCYAGGYWSITKKCATSSVHANSHHDLRVSVYACKGAPWWVWDINTGRSVAHGISKGRGNRIDQVIHGLSGYYKAKLTDSCYQDLIAISDY
jgi:hypothetical protein